ncbi:recombinase family protein [Rhodococcus wratislaviensis]
MALDRTFTDRAPGRDPDRPQLRALLGFVRDGDTVLVHSMDRLAPTSKISGDWCGS